MGIAYEKNVHRLFRAYTWRYHIWRTVQGPTSTNIIKQKAQISLRDKRRHLWKSLVWSGGLISPRRVPQHVRNRNRLHKQILGRALNNAFRVELDDQTAESVTPASKKYLLFHSKGNTLFGQSQSLVVTFEHKRNEKTHS